MKDFFKKKKKKKQQANEDLNPSSPHMGDRAMPLSHKAMRLASLYSIINVSIVCVCVCFFFFHLFYDPNLGM